MSIDEEHRDRLVDSLLWELVGKETPSDLRSRILDAIEEPPPVAKVVRMPASRPSRRQPARRSIFPALAAAAVVTLLASAGAHLYLQQISAARTPLLSTVSGTVDRSAGPISPGEGLETGPGSSAVLTYEDGTVVALSPETSLVLTKGSIWERSKGIELLTGGVEAEVAPQPEGKPMVLASEDARAEVIGTRLSFQLNDERTRLEVKEGKVRFISMTEGKAVIITEGVFAEAGKSGFQTGTIAAPTVRGIRGFTLMNAESDQPMREESLADGETISLAALPTRKINIRADYEGDPPATVHFNITRDDGDTTGVPAYATTGQQTPPFFMAGDHWAEGRPDDCRAWTPRPGRYRLSAEARYAEDDNETAITPLVIDLQITE